jgi:hypothetical protein
MAMRRNNPDGDSLIWLIGAAAAGWYFWNKSQSSAAPAAAIAVTPTVAASIVASAAAAANSGMIPATLDTSTVPPPNANNLYQIAWAQQTGGYQVWGQDRAGNVSRVWVFPSQIPNPDPPNAGGICVSAVCPADAKYFQI